MADAERIASGRDQVTDDEYAGGEDVKAERRQG